MADADEFLTIAEAAQLMNVTPGAIYQWRRRRTGPPGALVGNRLLFRRRDIEAWVAARIAADGKGQRLEAEAVPATAGRRRGRDAA